MKYEDRAILLNQLVALAESEVPKNW
jgi:hypothetical protein